MQGINNMKKIIDFCNWEYNIKDWPLHSSEIARLMGEILDESS
jgi:hypothetical protein